MRELYPALEPGWSTLLPVGDGHDIYVERCGTPGALPVVFLHGGPGGGCKADHRQFFDPARYDIVLVDQRGAGRSRPLGGIVGNTTQALIADLELVRAHLGLRAWVLFGGSWGAALALAYAQAWPAQVLGLILRGSFLARRQDVQWFFGQGVHRLLPREWARFVARVALPDTDAAIDHLHARVFDADPARAAATAAAWSDWSSAVVMFALDQAAASGGGDAASEMTLAKARIELHYAKHGYFLAEGALLAGAGRLPRVPVHIVHGARDVTCPADAAWALHQAIPDSTLEILHTAGHLSHERPMVDALVRASDALADALGGN